MCFVIDSRFKTCKNNYNVENELSSLLKIRIDLNLV